MSDTPISTDLAECAFPKCTERAEPGNRICTAHREQRERERANRIRSKLQQLESAFGWDDPKQFETDDTNRAAIQILGHMIGPESYRICPYWNAFLWGDVGCGKSTLAYRAARRFIENDHGTARFIRLDALLNETEREKRKRSGIDPIDDLLDDAPEPLYILDDIAGQRPTAWRRDMIARIVETLYDLGESMIIVTSNYSPSQLVERLAKTKDDPNWIAAERIVSRLRHGSQVVHMTGPDRRVQEQAA